MVQFSYEIKDELGIHARPAGPLAKTAAGFKSSVSLQVGDATADAKKMISIMKLGARGAVIQEQHHDGIHIDAIKAKAIDISVLLKAFT